MLIEDNFEIQEEDSIQSARKLYVGTMIMRVEAICPSDAERVKMGIVPQEKLDSGEIKPVNYFGKNKDGHDTFRLDIWLRHDLVNGENREVFRVKHSVWLSAQPVGFGESGNTSVINDFGQTATITQQEYESKSFREECAWFKHPFRMCQEGEKELREFVNAWTAQTSQKESVSYEFKKLLTGALSALYAILQLKDAKGQRRAGNVKLALGVKENQGKHYQVCHKYITASRVNRKQADGTWKEVSEEQIYNAVQRTLQYSNSTDYGTLPNVPYREGLMRFRPWRNENAVEVSVANRMPEDDEPVFIPTSPVPASPIPAQSYKAQLVEKSIIQDEGDDDLPF